MGVRAGTYKSPLWTVWGGAQDSIGSFDAITMAFALRPTASLIPAKGKAPAFASCFRNAGQREVNSVAPKRGMKLTEKNRTDVYPSGVSTRCRYFPFTS